MKIIKAPSPNYSTSKYVKMGNQIHLTEGLMPWTLKWLQNPISNASCNALFARNGDVYELVDGKYRAWTAGRINQPSQRAKNIMIKKWGRYVKPDNYLWQWEFEGLSYQAFEVGKFTEKQYSSFIKYCKEKNIPIIPMLFLTHRDTAIDKPDLEVERAEILRRAKLKEPTEPKLKSKQVIKEEIIKLLDRL